VKRDIQKVIEEHEDERDAARDALRRFVDKVVIPSGDGLLQW
jgi:hypothetical protein